MSTQPESLDNFIADQMRDPEFARAWHDAEVRRDFEQLGCEAYPEGSSRHAYRMTASSFYDVGRDHPDFRPGETTYRCRDCGDAFVVLDSEMEAPDEEWDRD